MKDNKMFFDFLLFLLILCAFFTGFLYGEKIMGEDMKDYINKSCYCNVSKWNPFDPERDLKYNEKKNPSQ